MFFGDRMALNSKIRVLRFFTLFIITLVVLAYTVFWLHELLGVGFNTVQILTKSDNFSELPTSVHFVLSTVLAGLFILAMLSVVQLTRYFENGEFFTSKSISKLRHVALFLFLYTIVQFFLPLIAQGIAARTMKTGVFHLNIIFDVPVISMGVLAGPLFVLTHILEHARDAVNETELFL